MYYPEEVIEEVRSRNDIVAVVSQYVKMTKKGGNYFGCCPFHNEKTPSFSVSPGKQIYYCFGCGAGGNVVKFVMAYENYTFPEAVKMLAERVGMSLPEQEETEEQKQRASLRQKLLDINKDAATFFYYQLKSPAGANAWRYLTGRGLSEETIRKFGLGYSPMGRNGLYQYLKKKGYSDELLHQSGLFRINEKGVKDWFWNRAMFPIMDVNSKVIGFGGRVMGDGEPKYLNSPETLLFDKSRNMYGLNKARQSRKPYFLICEGYMDVIAMHQAGFDNAVASLGTAFTMGHCNLIKRYVKEVILTYDSDGAGQKAAMRAIPILKEAGISVRVLNMKPYKDPDEFIVHEGAEAFQKRIDEAVNSFLFECDVLRGRYDLKDPEKKTEFHRAVAAKLLAFPDELERSNYLEAVAARHQIPQEALRDMVRRMAAGHPQDIVKVSYADADEVGPEDSEQRGPEKRQKKAKEKDGGVLEAQRLILNWAASGDGRIRRLSEYMSPEDFTHPTCRKLAEELWAADRLGQKVDAAALMDRFMEDDEESSQVAGVFNTQLGEELTEAEEDHILVESIKRILRVSLDRKAKNATDTAALQQIIMSKAKLESLKIRLR